MEQKILVKLNTYFDSVTLMSISQRVQRLEGVEAAMIGMGTPLNQEVLQNLGFDNPLQAGPNDLIFAVRGIDSKTVENALAEAEKMMHKGVDAGEQEKVVVRSLEVALAQLPANLALISIPGAYAAREARQALDKGLHVMLFSDNVSIEDEIALKRLAHSKGLLLMGPDCGTAIINGVPLAFANAVRRGNIGIVGASGTGVQEVSVQIHRLGQGVSQVIGTGGRDLTQAVGGIMMLDGIEALKEDPATKVIVVVSKPAAPEVADKVFKALTQCGKPSVYYVIGDEATSSNDTQVRRAGSLLQAAQLAVAAAGGVESRDGLEEGLALKAIKGLSYGPKFVRGLFSGGTLCDEAMVLLSKHLGLIYSNGPLEPEGKLADPNKSYRHTVLDLGDDFFTVGRPHPMIDFSLRQARILQEAADPEVALILLDVVLGYGSNSDPAAELVPAIKRAREIAQQAGRKLIFAAYVCGTDLDPQNYDQQVLALQQAGVTIFSSNVAAAQFAAQVAKALKGGER